MNTPVLNLFIVDSNPIIIKRLQSYLDERFGKHLNVSSFYSGESALKKMDENTQIIILDYYLACENRNNVLQSIKKINPKIEVITLSSHEEIGIAIDVLHKGEKNYISKGERAWKKIISPDYQIINYPIRIIQREFGINKYVAMFLVAFISIGIVVFVFLKFIS